MKYGPKDETVPTEVSERLPWTLVGARPQNFDAESSCQGRAMLLEILIDLLRGFPA